MTTTVEILKDSISQEGKRLTTFRLRYWRAIHAELMTHRVFSRNASSSRAIPVHKMIEELRRDPGMPIYWGSNKPGMQAGEQLPFHDLQEAQKQWLLARDTAIEFAEKMINLGLHKQIANRILEPFGHINVVVTATDYQNFFTLRSHPDAQPEIKELSDAMMAQYAESKPELLLPGQWHLPYIEDADYLAWGITPKTFFKDAPDILDCARKISVARCARTSYLTHEGRQTSWDEDLKLFERLVGGQPLHASPAEHQATPDRPIMGSSFPGSRDYVLKGWEQPAMHGNFTGWVQYRKTLPDEFVRG